MLVLTINSGSSSLKYKVFDCSNFVLQLSGLIERIGSQHAQHIIKKTESLTTELPIADHGQAIACMMQELDMKEIVGIGHRVVHGGEAFQQPCLLNAQVMQNIEDLIPLAPLHNPANLAGIKACHAYMPDVPQVCVFDTAFHQSMPDYAYYYALPQELYQQHKIRRYGFHGTSHSYVAKRAAYLLKKPLDKLNLISLHLGNGASACAIKQGKSVDTSMGFTPLEGLVMGTRSGDLDPAIPLYLIKQGHSAEAVDTMLNKESGLKGLSSQSDMREISQSAQQGDKYAQRALDVFCYRIKKYIGAYYAVLGKVDAIIFTAGIGENAPNIRQQCCAGLEGLDIEIDRDRNLQIIEGEIQHQQGKIKIMVIPTNEGAEIAAQTYDCIQQRS